MCVSSAVYAIERLPTGHRTNRHPADGQRWTLSSVCVLCVSSAVYAIERYPTGHRTSRVARAMARGGACHQSTIWTSSFTALAAFHYLPFHGSNSPCRHYRRPLSPQRQYHLQPTSIQNLVGACASRTCFFCASCLLAMEYYYVFHAPATKLSYRDPPTHPHTHPRGSR